MNTHTEIKLRKIERASTLLRAVCSGLFALVVIVALVATAAVIAGRATSVNYYSQTIVIAELGLRSRLMLAAVGVATALVFLKALYHLRRLLGNYSRREIFTADSAGQIRQFGVSCMLWGLIKVIWAFLPLVVSTNPPHSFGLTIDSIIIGAVIVGISWFAEMATALREENDLTI
jgi:hypothetical protein